MDRETEQQLERLPEMERLAVQLASDICGNGGIPDILGPIVASPEFDDFRTIRLPAELYERAPGTDENSQSLELLFSLVKHGHADLVDMVLAHDIAWVIASARWRVHNPKTGDGDGGVLTRAEANEYARREAAETLTTGIRRFVEYAQRVAFWIGEHNNDTQ